MPIYEISTDLTEFNRSVPITIHITIDLNGPNGTKGPNRTQIPKWTPELPKLI